MPKYRISFTVSSGRNTVEKKNQPITRMDDEAAKKTYADFCQQANSEGVGPSVHPIGLFRLEEGGKETEIKVD